MNRIERPEVNPCKNGQLIFDKGAKILNGEKIIFSIKNEIVPHLTLLTKINLELVKDLNVRSDTVTLLEKTEGKKVHGHWS